MGPAREPRYWISIQTNPGRQVWERLAFVLEMMQSQVEAVDQSAMYAKNLLDVIVDDSLL
jgi:hypothetical protein